MDLRLINCRNIIPQLRGWHDKYVTTGLTIVGVHSPEFPWEKPFAKLREASGRLGIKFPVVPDNNFDKPATTAYTLQQIGTQIDATVNTTSDGKYNLKLTVTDRFTGPAEPQRVPNVPSFKNVVIASEAVLANAETVQFTAAPTPTSNEVFKIDVTLTVGNK